ncbi:MAG: 4-hydroxy-2-oxovalerate aldolase [SAR202 cluster bacterium]|nr:4-hydroxy-2-oxovalerate aldolase [SAR202 cluster bacterium]
MAEKRKIRLVDSTMRDGSHPMAHQYTVEQVTQIAAALDKTGVPIIEISHGDGLGGSSFNYGFSKTPEEDLIAAASKVMNNSKLAVLLLPGIGTQEILEHVYDKGARAVRIATHCTEADIAQQHIGLARELGMETLGFLMMAHMVEPEKLVEQAKLMESYGAEAVYVTDSAGALRPDGMRRRVAALRQALDSKTKVGVHCHNNLGLGIGNSLAGVEEGAEYVDGCCCGLGAGAGNAQTEVLAAVLELEGFDTGVDVYKIMDVAEDIVRPMMPRPQIIDRASLVLGYAGVYSSFLLHTYRAAAKFNVEPRDILMELGKRKVVGGQEDSIIDLAYELSVKQKAAAK